MLLTIVMVAGWINILLAATLKIDVRRDLSLKLTLQLEYPANNRQKENIRLLSRTINRVFPDRIFARMLFREKGDLYDGIILTVQDINVLMDTTNFVDFSFSRSFYKEKYYLKLLFNPGMFYSQFFTLLNQDNVNAGVFESILDRGNYLNILIRLPGKCTRTNMEKLENGYYFKKIYRVRENYHQQYILMSSYRFLPEVYFTLILIIIVLLFGIFKLTYRRVNKQN